MVGTKFSVYGLVLDKVSFNWLLDNTPPPGDKSSEINEIPAIKAFLLESVCV